jgi:hypothetical protein
MLKARTTTADISTFIGFIAVPPHRIATQDIAPQDIAPQDIAPQDIAATALAFRCGHCVFCNAFNQ